MNWLYAVLIVFLLLIVVVYLFAVKPGRYLPCLKKIPDLYRHSEDEGTGAVLPDPISGNQVELLVNGNEILPAMLAAIDSAETSIRWHVMLFYPDEAGTQLSDALVRAAQRGVKVQLAFDIDQSQNGVFFAPYTKEKRILFDQQMPLMLAKMRDAGIEILESTGDLTSTSTDLTPETQQINDALLEEVCTTWNHVDHRKILIIDSQKAIIGGMNVGNEYLYLIPADTSVNANQEIESRSENGLPEAWEKWQDSAVLLQGPAVTQVVSVFNSRWEILGGTPLEPETVEFAGDGIAIQVLNQRPGVTEISSAMVELMDNAQEEIYIAYPYVSHPTLLHHLEAAARRGVKVTFVYPGEFNDVSISCHLLRLFSAELMEAGIQLYENNDRMNHTKLMVVDRKYVLIGSHNFNYRSVRFDQELNILIHDPETAQQAVDRIFLPFMEQSDHLQEPYPMKWTPIDWLMVPFS